MNAPNTSERSALAVAEPQRAIGGRDLILQADNLNAMMRVAELMATSGQAVPRHLRKNPGACFAVTMQAMRWNMDPFALALKTYTTDESAPLAYEGQAVIAALNNSPLLATRLSFDWGGAWEKIIGKFVWRDSTKKTDEGGKPKKYLAKAWEDNEEQGLWCTVTATLAGEREPRTLQLFLMQARVRNSPLWVEDPRQQLAYLAARRWGRLYAPDVIMGVYTPDELEEQPEKYMGPADVVGAQVGTATAAAGAAGAAGKPLFPVDQFKANLPTYTKTIAGGKKTVDEVIATIQTKWTLSDEQVQELRAIKLVTEATPKADTAADAPKVTYAVLADRINGCTDQDTALVLLDEARALPADQQQELQAIVNRKFPQE